MSQPLGQGGEVGGVIVYLLILAMTLGGALGAFFFKQGAQKTNGLISIFIQPKIYVGGVFYVLSALLNIYLLRYLDYSVLYPMTAMTYVWSALLAKYCLGERITANKMVGIGAICVGVLLCA